MKTPMYWKVWSSAPNKLIKERLEDNMKPASEGIY